MSAFLGRVTTAARAVGDWLTTERRQAIYAFLSAAGALAVIAGYATPDLVDGWVAFAGAVLNALALVMASIVTRSASRATVYASAAALGAALVTLGVVSDADMTHYLQLIGQALTAAGLLLAAVRTRLNPEPLRGYWGGHKKDGGHV